MYSVDETTNIIRKFNGDADGDISDSNSLPSLHSDKDTSVSRSFSLSLSGRSRPSISFALGSPEVVSDIGECLRLVDACASKSIE